MVGKKRWPFVTPYPSCLAGNLFVQGLCVGVHSRYSSRTLVSGHIAQALILPNKEQLAIASARPGSEAAELGLGVRTRSGLGTM